MTSEQGWAGGLSRVQQVHRGGRHSPGGAMKGNSLVQPPVALDTLCGGSVDVGITADPVRSQNSGLAE